MAFGDVDYGSNRPLDVTIELVDGGSDTFYLDDYDTPDASVLAVREAESLVDSILTSATELEARAKRAGDEAQAAIKEALSYKPTFDGISFDPPEFNEPSFEAGVYGVVPVVETYRSTNFESYAPLPNVAAFTSGSADSPAPVDLDIQPPASMGSNAGAPAAPDTPNLSVKPAPTVSLRTLSAVNIPAPQNTLDIDPDLLFNTIEPMNISPIDVTALESVTAAFDNWSGGRVTVSVPNYNVDVDGIFAAVGGTASEIYNDEVDLTYDDDIVKQHKLSVDTLWSQRGFTAPVDDVYSIRIEAKLRRELTAAVHLKQAESKVKYELLSRKLNQAAEVLVLDTKLALYDTQFQAALADARAQLEVSGAVVDIHNAKVAMYNAEVEVYRAGLAEHKATLDEYKALMDAERIKGQVNGVIADAFVATERAKSSGVARYEQQIKLESAKLSVYAAQVRGKAAELLGQEVAVEQYKASIVEWEADLKSTLTNYALYSAQAKTKIATMRGDAAKQGVTVANNRSIEAQAQLESTKISVKASEIKTNLERESAKHVTTVEKNAATSASYRAQVAQYAGDVAAWSVQFKQQSAGYEGAQLYLSSASNYMQRSSASLNKAATLTQQIGSMVTSAHATMAEAMGRAGAAVEQGRLAGFRASKALSASASVSGDNGWSHSINSSGNQSYSYNESVQESISA